MLYSFFRDQGSIIGGVLALIAGLVLYIGALKQVSAVKLQTETLKQQNADLRQRETQQLAREALSTARLFYGISKNVLESTIPRGIPEKIPLDEIFGYLGKLHPEIIDKYFMLYRKIKHFHDGITMPERDEIRAIAKFINDEMAKESKKALMYGAVNDGLSRPPPEAARSVIDGRKHSDSAALRREETEK